MLLYFHTKDPQLQAIETMRKSQSKRTKSVIFSADLDGVEQYFPGESFWRCCAQGWTRICWRRSSGHSSSYFFYKEGGGNYCKMSPFFSLLEMSPPLFYHLRSLLPPPFFFFSLFGGWRRTFFLNWETHKIYHALRGLLSIKSPLSQPSQKVYEKFAWIYDIGDHFYLRLSYTRICNNL